MIWIAAGLIMLGAVLSLGRLAGPRPKPAGHVWRAVAAGLFALAATSAAAAGRWALVLPFLGVAGGFVLAFARAMQRSERLAETPADDAVPAASGEMSEKDALEILGLSTGASREDVLSAYRRVMARAHPDAGGTDRLAMLVDRAKRRLLDG